MNWKELKVEMLELIVWINSLEKEECGVGTFSQMDNIDHNDPEFNKLLRTVLKAREETAGKLTMNIEIDGGVMTESYIRELEPDLYEVELFDHDVHYKCDECSTTFNKDQDVSAYCNKCDKFVCEDCVEKNFKNTTEDQYNGTCDECIEKLLTENQGFKR